MRISSQLALHLMLGRMADNLLELISVSSYDNPMDDPIVAELAARIEALAEAAGYPGIEEGPSC